MNPDLVVVVLTRPPAWSQKMTVRTMPRTRPSRTACLRTGTLRARRRIPRQMEPMRKRTVSMAPTLRPAWRAYFMPAKLAPHTTAMARVPATAVEWRRLAGPVDPVTGQRRDAATRSSSSGWSGESVTRTTFSLYIPALALADSTT